MIVDCAVYIDGRRQPGALPLQDALEASREKGAFVWIGIFEPTYEEFAAVKTEFGLHELAIEDAIKAHQRPKVEHYDDFLFMVLKSAEFTPPPEQAVVLEEIQLFVGERFLITVRHGHTALHEVRLSLEAQPELLRQGAITAVHAIVDKVVDDYFPVVERINEEVREVESEVFSSKRTNPAERIYKLKREVLALDEAVSPLPEELARIARGQDGLVPERMLPYFRDIHDHLLRLTVQIENIRELLTNVLTANLTQVGVRQNEDVRKISAWAAVVAVPTMIAGIYGMNFEDMPELGWSFGYPLVLGVILVSCTGLFVYFKRAGWL